MKASEKPLEKSVVYVVETRDLLLSLMDSVSFSVYPLLKLPDLLKLPERTYGNTKFQNDPSNY